MKPSPIRPASLRGDRAGGGDVDRDRGFGAVVDRGLVGPEELALEGHPVLAGKPAHQFDRLAQAGKALLEGRPGHAGRRHLVQRLAGADPEQDAPGVEGAERPDRLGDDRGVVAEGGGDDAGADDGARGALAQSAHPGERKRRVAAGVAPGLEVVADQDRIEAHRFGVDREIEQLAGRELLCRGFVAELQHSRPRRIRGSARARRTAWSTAALS